MSYLLCAVCCLLGLTTTTTQAREKHVGCYYSATTFPWSAHQRPGMGQFWPENIDPGLCDVIYYGYGNIRDNTFEVCSWDPEFDLGPADTGIQGCGGEDLAVGGEHDGIRRTIELKKKKKTSLKVLFSVGS